MRNMETADRETDHVRASLRHLEVAAGEAGKALDQVRVSQAQAYESRSALETIERSVSSVSHVAILAANHLNEVKVSQAQAAQTKVATSEIKAELNSVIAKAIETRAALRGVNAGGGVGGAGDGGLLAGVLPGGARPRPGAVGALAGLGLTALPELGAATLGLGAGGAAALTAIGGSAATLLVALKGINAEAFKTKEAFDALSPAQQQLVQDVRSLGAGLGHELKQISEEVLPHLSQELHSIFTPGTTAAITADMHAFADATGMVADEWGRFLGGPFGTQLGEMLQRDAGYLVPLNRELMNMADFTVQMLNVGGPFTDWLSQTVEDATASAAAWAHSADGVDALSATFETAQQGLEDVAAIVRALVHDLDAIARATDTVDTLGLLANVLEELAQVIDQNRNELRSFFAGIDAAAGDVLAVVRALEGPLHVVVQLIDGMAGAVGGWRIVFDGMIAWWVAKWALAKVGVDLTIRSVLGLGPAVAAETAVADVALAELTLAARTAAAALASIGPAAAEGAAVATAAVAGTGAAAGVAAGEVGALRFALMSLGSPVVLAALAAGAGGLYLLYKAFTSEQPTDVGQTETGAGTIVESNGRYYTRGNGGVPRLMPYTGRLPDGTYVKSGIPQFSAAGSSGEEASSSPGRAGGFKGGHGGYLSGKSLEGVNPIIVEALKALAEAGHAVNVTSGFRTESEQAALYARYVKSGFDRRFIAAKPGTSDHEFGKAVDVLVDGVPIGQSRDALALMKKFGLGANVPGDAVHLAMLGAASNPYGTPSPLTTDAKKPKIRSGLDLLPTDVAIALQNAEAAAAAAGGAGGGSGRFTDPGKVIAANREIVSVAREALSYLDKQNASGKEAVNVAKERKALEKEIAAANRDIHSAQKQQREDAIAKKERAILGIGDGGAAATPSVLSLRARAKAAAQEIATATGQGLETTEARIQIAKLQRVLKFDYIPPDVRQAVASQISTLKQTISQGMTELLQDAKQKLSESTSAFESGFGELTGAADTLFQRNVASHVQTMQDALNDGVAAMQVLVHGPFGDFLFGAGGKTPAQRAREELQRAKTEQDLGDNLKRAQDAVAKAKAGGGATIYDAATGSLITGPVDEQAVLDAQRQLADAEFAMKDYQLQRQETLEQDAAATQLKAAQDAYAKQKNEAIQAYQDQQTLVKAAMDQQVAAIVAGMESGKIGAETGMGQIKEIWKKNGLELESLSFVLGGQIYTGLAAGIAPIFGLLKTLIEDLNRVRTLTGQPTVTPGEFPTEMRTIIGPGQVIAMGDGGYVPPRPGGSLRLLAERGKGEYVFTEDQMAGMGSVSVVVPISGDVYALDSQEFARRVAPAIRSELIRIGRSNTTIFGS